ncbi:uncharacterized protein G2W53_001394 [Senna tora]|uniref:Uncharacterized protein n=1 Tax=Senna tora TaxID=362788 RepID=A0A834SYW2_9FABA|nr:uncharacterized protein G2W53_033237 [Senna tora]KAF7844489.1 uncharacterized protein G2W53_001394 [Senna tora]
MEARVARAREINYPAEQAQYIRS